MPDDRRSNAFRAARTLVVFVATACAGTFSAGSASAGEVRLKNGTVLSGKPVPILGMTQALIQQSRGPTTVYPMLMIDSGMQRYIVGSRLVEDVNRDVELSRFETYEIPQKLSGRKQMLQTVGAIVDRTLFDEFGRRRVTFLTPNGPLHIVQGITKITPQHVSVSGLTHVWEHALATSSIDPPILDAILRRVTDQAKAADRLAIASFYLQAGRWPEGDAELASIARDFPELRDKAVELSVNLRQLWAQELLVELRRRRQSGQHELAFVAAKNFPREKMNAAVVRQVDEIVADVQKRREQRDLAVTLLGELQSQLVDPAVAARVSPLRTELKEQLDLEALDRLDAFLKLSIDPGLSPQEKLALAYSGWVLGSANALTDLDAALRLWDAQFLVKEYLRDLKPGRRTDIVGELTRLESVGAERVLRMIPQLPPWIETTDVEPGQPRTIEVPTGDPERPLRYDVLLPEEYSPHHRYPLIVTLRPAERSPQDMLTWWGLLRKHENDPGVAGQSQRRGYVVIAPHYVPEKTKSYESSAAVQQAVIDALRDAGKRFSIDADRTFLSGHGMGGDAAFDVGLSHPDLFAGVIPIGGICPEIGKWYWKNAKLLGWYVVAGELDRNQLEKNSRELTNMLRNGYDVIYCEYVGRGYESFYEEIHRLFDWMDLHRRAADPKEIEADTLRPSESRFYWCQAEGIPPKLLAAYASQESVRPLSLSARVTAGNSIDVKSGAARHTVWLAPDVVDFEKRTIVRLNGKQQFNEFLKPDLTTILEDLRLRADRQRVYSVKLTF